MKSLLIIGGNSDIGFELAKKFAQDDYKIILASRNIEDLKKKKNILNKMNTECEIYYFDLEQNSSYESFLENLCNKPNIIILCAGYLEKEEKNYDKIININYLSLLNFIEIFISKKDLIYNLKSIIGISSLAGERGKERLNVYSSAKAGFSNYLDGLRQRLFKQNISVVTVKPGFVKTKMTKDLNLNSFLTLSPEKIAKKIYDDFKKNKLTIYPSLIWKFIIFIYKLIPEKIFVKLKT